MHRPILTAFALVMVACWAPTRGAGQDSARVPDPSRHPEAARAISQLRSPYCPGLMLEVCVSAGAERLRDSIDTMARSGLPADSIVERVVAEYGEEWRAVPRREGAGWWAWLLPPLVLTAGAVMVVILLLRRRRTTAEADGASPAEEDARKLRDALDDLDESERPEW